MNKLFFYIVIIISFLSIASIFSLTIIFPHADNRSYDYLKDFKNEFPNISQLGFYSDFPFENAVLYPLQNSIVPVIIKNDTSIPYFFCYSEFVLCTNLIKDGKAILIKKYSKDLFLMQRTGSNI